MQIHNELLELRKKEKQITSEILEKLQLMEDSRGYLKMGYNSLFDYLVRGLSYSEATAYQRQACVRLARDVPEIMEKIDQGALSVSAITSVFKHIRHKPIEQKREVLSKIENKSSREVKKLFAEPMVPIKIKKSEYQDKVFIRLELTHEQNKKLERLKALKSHRHSLESLFENLIEKELKAFENVQYKAPQSQNPRQISRRLRNDVLKASQYACQYPGCKSNYFLQVDHIVPVRFGGDQKRRNLQVLCASHNRMKG
jgi:5-methylcytosine-specific restriction endonuclease McrA